MEAFDATRRFDWLALGRLFVHVYSPTLIRMYEKKSLSSAYDLDPVTLHRTGDVKSFSRTIQVLVVDIL